MKIHEATEIVCSAALANANGHSNCQRIMAAVDFLRAYIRDQDEPSARPEGPSTHNSQLTKTP